MKMFLLIVLLLITGMLHAQYYGMDSVQFPNGFKGLALKPADYNTNPGKRYALIVAIGGNGEVGYSLSNLFGQGIPRRVMMGKPMYQVMAPGDTARFLFVCPLPDVSTRGGQPNFVNGAIDYMIANYRVDTTKIMVSGLSQGGNDILRYGLWTLPGDPTWGSLGGFDYRQQRVKFYVSGSPPLVGSPFDGNYSRFNTYGWGARFFHGALDGGVTNPGGSQIMNDSINKYHPGSSQRFLLAAFGHDANVWDSMYSTNGVDSNINIYRWLVMSPGSSSNPAPVATAGSNQTITLPANTVSLTGTGTGLNGASISAYLWTKTSGPAGATITSSGTANTTVTGLVQGVYVFTLTVTDTKGMTGSASVSITVNAANQPPTVNAGANQTINLPVSTLTLSGTATGSNGATITTYQWSQTSGPSAAGIVTPAAASTTINGLVQGVYVFSLSATDNRGLSGSASVVVTVNPAVNLPPIANAGGSQTITLPTNSVNLTGTGTGNNGASITAYQWSQTSGPSTAIINSSNTASTAVTGLVQGVYIFTLTITDNNGLSASANVTITVNAVGNLAPSANAGGSQSINLPANTVNLNGSGTGNNGATISSYQWVQASGPSTATIATAGAASTSVSGLVQGNYVFTLTVTDNNGLTGSSSVSITVNAAANQPPSAFAGGSQFITLPVSTVTLSGSGTGNNGASISSYQWIQVGGPVTAVISTPASASSVVTGLSQQGIYMFTIIVTDNHGLSSSASVLITVNASPNTPPTANAGGSQSISLPVNSVTLTGTGTGTNGATITSYQWVQTSGPAGATIATAAAASTTVSGLVQGNYVFTLTVTDNHGLTASASVSIIVNAAASQPPSASAGGSQSITLPVSTVTLSGSGTGNGGASIVSYQWMQVGGPVTATINTAGAASTTVSGLSLPGTYTFTIIVTDNHGLSSSASVVITVNAAANTPPTANAGGSQSVSLPVNSVTLTGTGTGTNGATITSYQWVQTGGPAGATIATAAAASTSVSGLVQGNYVFTLTVTDNHGLSSSASVVITVNAAANTPPTANAGGSQSVSLPVSTVTLSGSGTGTNGATITSYQWVQTSGPAGATIATAAAASTTVSGLVQGNYVFTLTVTDNHGLSSNASVVITVNAAANQPPAANAGGNQSITLPLNTVGLSGTGSGNGGATIVSYLWSQSSGPAAATIATATAASTTVSGLVQGNYVFTLTVTDNHGLSSSASVSITVNAAANQPPVANAGADIRIVLPINSVVFDGTQSYDPDGTIAGYSWNKLSGPGATTIVNSNTATASAIGLTAGVYVFELTVTDNQGATARDQVVVTVDSSGTANAVPVADAGKDTSITLPSSSVVLSGINSREAGGSIVYYGWKQLTGPSAVQLSDSNAAVTTAQGLVEGVYEFLLTVKDNAGATGEARVKVTVINSLRNSTLFKLYPNPATGILHVQFIDDKTGKLSIAAYDAMGKLVLQQVLNKDQSLLNKDLNVVNLKPGMYYLEILQADGQKMVRPFVKQ